MSDLNNGVVGETLTLHLSKLSLDLNNPRFELAEHETTQADLANKLILGYDVYTLAESIARNGYFANEPIVVIPDPDDQTKYIVIEGNRRLTALKCLCDAEFRTGIFNADSFEKLASTSVVSPEIKIPVILVTQREKINPILGYRHISGINGWQPLAQARFVAKLIDEDGLTFEEAAESVGKKKSEVANMYRNQAIAKQAQDAGFPIGKLEASFSLLEVAMNAPALREFIDAPLGAATKSGEKPVPESKIPELGELLGWLFGTEEHESVISDSRDIPKKLAKVVKSEPALKILREDRDIKVAMEALEEDKLDPLARLLNRLKAAEKSSEAAYEDIGDYKENEQVIALVDQIQSNVSALGEMLTQDSSSGANADIS
jgi:hypothetical protein